jgi:CheY-like chemotaxis protein/HPt (histidine-containing phosphotransfer) domain-containing protein
VLLVDDSEINLEVARRLLEGRGARVQTCTSGNTALSCLRDRPTDFDVVLMDVQMPDMDGLEATRRIRSELGLKDLPVIALTAGALMEERRRALDAGMQGFLSKPLDPVDLIRVVRQCVETARGCILPVTGLETKAAGVTLWPVIEGIDAADVKRRLDNDVPLFLSLLRQLLAEFGDIEVATGSASESAEQLVALTARMHKLRGCAGTVGAHEVQHLCATAEASLRAGEANAGSAVRAVSLGLARLAENSAAALAASPRAGDIPRVDDGRLTPTTTVTAGELIERLQRQLKCQDLAALDTFSSVRSALLGVLGASAVESICTSLEALEFTPAMSLLAAGLDPGKPIEALL